MVVTALSWLVEVEGGRFGMVDLSDVVENAVGDEREWVTE